MTGTSRSSEGLSERRRKLLYRSWHRGIRETDLIMGPFADVCIATLSEAELDIYETLLEVADRDLYSWVVGEFEPPPSHDTALFRKLRDFHLSAGADGQVTR
jgi:antitoxin CptB